MTLHDYQLATLHPMCDSAPTRAAELLHAVGATRSDAAEAEHRWLAWLENDQTVNDYEALGWGTADYNEIHNQHGHEIRYARWVAQGRHCRSGSCAESLCCTASHRSWSPEASGPSTRLRDPQCR
ncbi:hypothetical protein ACIA8C_05255 [Nocardia sp. NPDC051321]|uniref:hypothetical protein n=1 Tax=Nocardia sp. NPDC051321 TaxID=3364323 RepID=UPI00379F27A3